MKKTPRERALENDIKTALDIIQQVTKDLAATHRVTWGQPDTLAIIDYAVDELELALATLDYVPVKSTDYTYRE